MIKFENTEVLGWKSAISGYCFLTELPESIARHTCNENRNNCGKHKKEKEFIICPNDLDLMNRLRNAGTDHRKFMRMITVYIDITAPLYWWKEFDTYKVGTVANSCSTMHKIHMKEFKLDDFSTEHLIEGSLIGFEAFIDHLNVCREAYLQTKDKKYWWQMIQLLPSSYNQKRTVMLNYEVLANIYKSRRNHKLDEWRIFCNWIETLPYSELITGDNERGI